jgi:phage terminase Nu1 subunit (DNA packaging protein)
MRKEKIEKPRIVGTKRLAEILNLTPRRIQQLVKEGLPKRRRGKYDQDECTRFYIRYLLALGEKKGILGEGGAVLENEREVRLRLLSADADLRELELARTRSQLVAIEDVEHEMADLIRITRARVLTVAAMVAQRLVGETSRVMVQAVIDKATREVLAELAKNVPGL